MALMALTERQHVQHAEESERARGTRRRVSAAKLRAVAFASFAVWLYILIHHVLSAGWDANGGALFTALSALSGLTYLRPGWILALLQRWGG